MSGSRPQAAKLGGRGLPELAVVPAAGAGAKTPIGVPGLKINDVIVSIVNLTDGDTEVLEEAGHETIVLKDSTSSDKLLVIFWSVGLGGNPTGS